MRTYLISLPILTLIFAMMLDSFDPWDLAVGAVLATMVFMLFESFVFPIGTERGEKIPHVPFWSRLLYTPIFLLVVMRNITVGTFQVMSFVLKIRPINYQGVVEYQIGERSEAATVMMAYADNLTPGSVVAVFDEERNVLWAHVISWRDLDVHREEGQELYDKYQRKVVP